MEKMNVCFELMGFGMSSILLNFGDKYYKYEVEGLLIKG